MTGQDVEPAGESTQPAAGPAQPAPEPAQPAGGPVLEVVGGRPSAEELAALTAVLAATLTRGDHEARPGRPGQAASAWASRSRGLRAPLRHGPAAWRRSGRPA